MAAAAILENRKIAIFRLLFDRFRPNVAWQCISTLLSRGTVKNLKFRKSKMVAAAILENPKIAISQPQFDRFRRNLIQWHSLTFLGVPAIKVSKISKSKMVAAAILENRKIAISRPLFDRFRRNLAWWRNLALLRVSIVQISKKILHSDKDHQMPFVGGPNTRIANPRWRTAAILEKSKNRYISNAVWPTSTKFGTTTQFGPLEPLDR